MSFKSLLFCPDEKNARLVTQVLSELDFTVEPAGDPFAAVKRLTDEQFDALVVDCQNEQDASLLFKAARNSSHNHSSLSVAVVEGQAGVAKAFRIGANLVLTKPVNVEQSKSTLRVARGLLRKGQAKTAPSSPGSEPQAVSAAPASKTIFASPAAPTPATPSHNESSFNLARAATASAQSAAPAPAPRVPFSGLELEKEPAPTPEAADAALLDSMPDISKKMASPAPPVSLPSFGGGTLGLAAAPAPAPEKKVIEPKAPAMGTLVSYEPVVRERGVKVPEHFVDHDVPVPTFGTLHEKSDKSPAVVRFFKIVFMLVLFGTAGYLGWPKLRDSGLLDSLHRSSSTAPVQVPGGSDAPATSAKPAKSQAAPTANAPVSDDGMTFPDSGTPSDFPADGQASTDSGAAAQPASHEIKPEKIEIKDSPKSKEDSKPAKITVVPKPQAMVVKPGKATQPSAQIAPPSVDFAQAGSEKAEIASIVSAPAVMPKPAPGVIRISQGVSQGLLTKKVAPVYPAIAQQFHREGTVQLLATISKYGEVTKVQVLSGDPVLAKAAVDAVKQWEYRPYLLNEQPVEIETQINVVFKSPR